jgi:hypothetical protein
VNGRGSSRGIDERQPAQVEHPAAKSDRPQLTQPMIEFAGRPHVEFANNHPARGVAPGFDLDPKRLARGPDRGRLTTIHG